MQDGVFVIPYSPFHEEALEDLAHDVRNDGGEANVVGSASIDDERHLRARLSEAIETSARDAE